MEMVQHSITIRVFQIWFRSMEAALKRALEHFHRALLTERRLIIRGEAEKFYGVVFIMEAFLMAWVLWA